MLAKDMGLSHPVSSVRAGHTHATATATAIDAMTHSDKSKTLALRVLGTLQAVDGSFEVPTAEAAMPSLRLAPSYKTHSPLQYPYAFCLFLA